MEPPVTNPASVASARRADGSTLAPTERSTPLDSSQTRTDSNLSETTWYDHGPIGVKISWIFLKMDASRPLFVHFRPFLITNSIIQIEKSIDSVRGIQPGLQDGRRRQNHEASWVLLLLQNVNKTPTF